MNTAVGCITLFLLPFAGVGVFAAVQTVRMAAQGEWGQAAFFALFAITFGGVGIGGLVALARGRRRLAEAEAARARHPDEPWLWRADWAAGRIEDSNRTAARFAWVFAGFWNLVSLPAGYFGVRAAVEQGNRGGLVALLFPVAGVGLLVWAARISVRLRRFGVSRLELETCPAAIGRSLAGTVLAPLTLMPAGGFRVALSCIRRVTTGSGDGRSTSERVLWQEEQRVDGRPSRTARGMATMLPVRFPIPPDALPCDDRNSRDTVLWRLEVSAEVPGVDYASAFEVPVFRTAESDRPRTDVETAAAQAIADQAAHFEPGPECRIQVTRNRRGTEIVFPAARNRGAALDLTLFLALWLGAVAAMVLLGAPVIFPLVFGLFAALLIRAVLDLWLGVARVTAGDGAVLVASGLLTPGRERRVPSPEVAEVVTRIGMQAGGTPYYDVVLVRRDGKKLVAGRGIRDKREAEWVAGLIREGVDPKAHDL
ncbi:MAG TPA: hypothetical protein VJQ44_17310 [Gemmatimonadales bacterium]|nr:hypothetical protein [Gemmatimonadales bacterium]